MSLIPALAKLPQEFLDKVDKLPKVVTQTMVESKNLYSLIMDYNKDLNSYQVLIAPFPNQPEEDLLTTFLMFFVKDEIVTTTACAKDLSDKDGHVYLPFPDLKKAYHNDYDETSPLKRRITILGRDSSKDDLFSIPMLRSKCIKKTLFLTDDNAKKIKDSLTDHDKAFMKEYDILILSSADGNVQDYLSLAKADASNKDKSFYVIGGSGMLVSITE